MLLTRFRGGRKPFSPIPLAKPLIFWQKSGKMRTDSISRSHWKCGPAGVFAARIDCHDFNACLVFRCHVGPDVGRGRTSRAVRNCPFGRTLNLGAAAPCDSQFPISCAAPRLDWRSFGRRLIHVPARRDKRAMRAMAHQSSRASRYRGDGGPDSLAIWLRLMVVKIVLRHRSRSPPALAPRKGRCRHQPAPHEHSCRRRGQFDRSRPGEDLGHRLARFNPRPARHEPATERNRLAVQSQVWQAKLNPRHDPPFPLHGSSILRTARWPLA